MIEFEALIFLPGASGNTDFWQPVCQQLNIKGLGITAESKIIAYPEFNGHPEHLEVDSFEDLQRYVLNQIDQPAVLIAQSMGGIFAVQAALEKPKLVSALVLIATSGGIDLSPFDVADWREDYQKQFSVPSWFVDHQQSLDDQLDQIQCPVLLIWGDNDAISPVAVGQYLESKLKNAELHIIAKGEHDLAYVYAHQVAQLIHQFIQKQYFEA